MIFKTTLLLLSVIAYATFVHSYSVIVGPRKKSCFGQNLKKGKEGNAFLEIQVTRGGETDISYQLLDPYGNIVRSAEKVQSDGHEFNVTQDGQYQLCLDNLFSSSTSKVVMLEINHAERDSMQVLLNKHFQKEGNAEKGLSEEFRGIVSGLMKNSDKLERYSEIAAAKKRRHYFLVENNLSRVNGFSFLSCILMIIVGVLQVFIVKGLFEDGNRKPFRFW